MNAGKTVFIIDDDSIARQSVSALVQSKGGRTKTFESAEEFFEKYQPSEAGCVVVDVRMDGMSGIDFQKKLVERDIPLPVIVITGFGTVPLAVNAMKAGAVSFLEKPCEKHELLRTIELALKREETLRSLSTQRFEIESRLNHLTDDEKLVLDKLLEGEPNKRIASALDIGLRTVELRRSNIMKKMKSSSIAELIRLVMTSNYPVPSAG